MTTPNPRASRGFSYIEVLIVTGLIAVSLVPAMESLQIGIQASAVHESRTVNQFRLQGRMEKVLAQSVDVLRTAAGSASSISNTFSDPVSEPDRLLVYIARYSSTGSDRNLLLVRVAVEGSADSLETLVHVF